MYELEVDNSECNNSFDIQPVKGKKGCVSALGVRSFIQGVLHLKSTSHRDMNHHTCTLKHMRERYCIWDLKHELTIFSE